MIVVICGEEKSWKSTMALTFPRKLVHFDLDVGGWNRASWRIDKTDVVSKPYLLPIQMEKLMGLGPKKDGVSVRFPRKVVGYKETWQKIVIDFVAACQDESVKTVVMDSGTQLWTIAHTGLLQEKQEIQLSRGMKEDDDKFRERLQPVEFPNDRMRTLIYTAGSYHKHLILTHYPKPVYKEKVTEKGIESYKSDEVTVDGFKETERLADLVVWLSMEKDKEGHLASIATITRCGIEGMGTAAHGLTIDPSYQGILDLQETMRGG